MKKLLLAMALGSAGAMSTSAQALVTSDTFDVDITLTPVCTVAVTQNVAFTYLSLTGVTSSTDGLFSVTCTTGAPYTFTLEQPVGTTLTAPYTITDQATQIQYTLNLPAPVATGGSGVAQNYSITTTVAGAQAGQCGGTGPAFCTNTGSTNKTFTLVVNY